MSMVEPSKLMPTGGAAYTTQVYRKYCRGQVKVEDIWLMQNDRAGAFTQCG